MAKSSNAERAQRINSALSLIEKHDSIAKAASAMADQYGISKRQAYRYVREAKKIGKRVAIPDPKIAFTVKLSRNMILAVRQKAKNSGQTLSEIVTQSLEAFLHNGRGRG